jgi:hypothetical protein
MKKTTRRLYVFGLPLRLGQILLVAVLGVLSTVRSTALAAQDATASAPIEDPEAYAIYAHLLSDHWMVKHARATVLVIQKETQTDTSSRCTLSREALESDWRPVLDDFEAANAGARTLLGGDQLGRPYMVVPSAEIRAAMDTSAENPWAGFHRRYPDARGYLQVSAVGFDAEKRRAMVYLAHYCGLLCGGGRHHFLQKVDGVWQTVKPPMASFCEWIS